MPVATRLSQYIHQKGIECQPIHHARSGHYGQAIEAANAVSELCLKAVVLIDRRGPAMAVIPFLADLDVDKLNSLLDRQFQIVPEQQAGKIFKDCEPGAIPALGMAYGMPVLLDADVLDFDHCFMQSGCFSTLLRLPKHALATAMQGAIKVRVSNWPDALATELKGQQSVSPVRTLSLDAVAKKLESVYKLPPMPETAVRIMHLTADPESDVFQLAELIERDPSLSAQVMRYARSALFNYRGELTCIKDAVNIVLGFDRVSQLAMGIAAAKAFSITNDGPLGLENFWKHALYSGVLCQALALLANPDLELNDKDAYLAGLLHNFGILLIGHLFPPEFKMLNKLRDAEPEASMSEIEQQVFGMGSAQEFIALGHGSMGAILLKMWGMPDSTIKAAAMHQNHGYEGDASAYVELVQLSNHLLSMHGVGDEISSIEPSALLASLGIDEEQALTLVEVTVDQCRSLDGMTSQMVA